MYYVDGKPVATRSIFRDITERKEVERMKDEFISTVSHELRTPLTSIVGSLGLIAGGAAGELPAQAKMMLDIAHRNSERLFDDLLKQAGFSTDIAYDIAQAKRLLAQNQYAVMTLNPMFPSGDGILFIRELREEERTRNLPIVVVSGKAQEGCTELINGEAFLVMDWINEPIGINRLITAVKKAVAHTTDHKPCILHVEDDLDVLRVTSAMLKDTADVLYAVNLQEAKEKLEQQPFDLIILDLNLPDGNGLELIPILPSQSPPIPVIIFSVQDVDKRTVQKVAAAMVKSRTSNQKLLDTIKLLVNRGDSLVIEK